MDSMLRLLDRRTVMALIVFCSPRPSLIVPGEQEVADDVV
jgi:hypothetical protein